MPLDVAALRELRPQNHFEYFGVVESTMTEAANLALSGAPHGLVVVADEQTAGVGRFGRSWLSEPDAGVYASVLLRLALSPSELPVASLLIGLATSEAIEKTTDLACDLRWPNDVLVGEKKAAGILPQLVDDCIIAGIGINVNNRAFPQGLRTPATSLLLASGGAAQSRERLLAELLGCLDSFCDLLLHKGAAAIVSAFAVASSYANGRRVSVEESGLEGITAGLDEHGFLLIRSATGSLHRVSSGGIRPVRESAG